MKKLLTMAAIFCALAGKASAGIIGIDDVHGYSDADYLASSSKFEEFRAVLSGMGHTIVPLSGFAASDLAGLDAAFVLIASSQNTHSSYSAADAAALHSLAGNHAVFLSDTSLFADSDTLSDRPISFGDNQLLLENIVSFLVSNGGVAFLADGGDGFNVVNYNTVVAPYGVSFADMRTDINGRTVTGFVPHEITAGLNQIGVDLQLPLTIVGPAIDLTVGGGQDNVLAVIPEPGSLLLLALGLAAFRVRRKLLFESDGATSCR